MNNEADAQFTSVVDPTPAPPLSADDLALLAFERQGWRYRVVKEQAIAERFGWTPTAYYLHLDALIDRPEALAYDPGLIQRLRRRRQRRGGLTG